MKLVASWLVLSLLVCTYSVFSMDSIGVGMSAIFDDNGRLIEQGQQPGRLMNETDQGSTVLHAACIEGNVDLVIALTQSGADITALDKHKRTALHLAAFRGSRDICLQLLLAGARLHRKDKDGLTPLHIAAGRGHLAVCQTLMDKGADSGAQDVLRRTPFFFARKNKHEPICALLLRRSAPSVNGSQQNGRGALSKSTQEALDADMAFSMVHEEHSKRSNLDEEDAELAKNLAALEIDECQEVDRQLARALSESDLSAINPMHDEEFSRHLVEQDSATQQDQELAAQIEAEEITDITENDRLIAEQLEKESNAPPDVRIMESVVQGQCILCVDRRAEREMPCCEKRVCLPCRRAYGNPADQSACPLCSNRSPASASTSTSQTSQTGDRTCPICVDHEVNVSTPCCIKSICSICWDRSIESDMQKRCPFCKSTEEQRRQIG